MSLALLAAAAAVLLATIVAAVSLWRGAARQPWPDLRAYRWFTIAAGLICASVIVGLTVRTTAGAAPMLSFTDLPALLVLPVMAAGLAGLASAARRVVPEAQPPRRPGLAAACAYLADGYVLVAALFLIGWVTLFGAEFTHVGAGPSFAVDLVHPLVDLMVLLVTLPLVQTAGRRAVAPYLALVAITAGDSLAVGARIAGTRPGFAALAAALIALVLLALTPWVSDAWAAGGRRLGGAREVTTATVAAAATIAGLLVVAQAIVTGHLTGLVEILILGTMAGVLAGRVVSLVWRVDTWSRVWQESGRQFRQLAERTSDVVLLCEANGVIRYASQAVTGYGYAPDSLRGKPVADLLHPEERAAGMEAIRRAITSRAQRPGHYPCQVRAEDGTWRHVEATVSRYREPGQPDLVLITARDMSAQVALRRQVTHLTFHDGLTGLPNRAYAEQRAHDVLSEDRNAAAAAVAVADPPLPGVIVVDIDGFTAVNDARGHTAGDLLLAQVARRLRLAVSPEDTVARWGGDEFAVITEATVNATELADIAERLARGVAAMPFRIGDTELSITASVGAAIADGSTAAHMWRNAEMALARAKAAGGAQVEMFNAGDDTATAGAGQAGMFGAGDEAAEGAQAGMFGAGDDTGTGEPEQAPADAAASQQSGAA
jgi:diguanylate cyclase (GGDEF)-like protein/PAS domain S-box-containing protein